MAKSIIMPKAEMAMTEGTIIQWLVEEGEILAKGQPVLEIETDKSTMEVESDYEGTLLKILHQEDTTLPVTTVIAWVGEEGEEVPDAPEPAVVDEDQEATVASASTPARLAPARSVAVQAGRVPATPAAKRIARERGLALTDLFPPGRTAPLKAADVRNYQPPVAAALSPTDFALTPAEVKVEDGDEWVRMTNVQKTSARRMVEAHVTVPAVTLHADANVTELSLFRARLKAEGGQKITYNDLVLKALAAALKRFPQLNAVYQGDSILRRGHINLAIAVATERGLLVPVIRDADRMSLAELSVKARELAEKARAGELDAGAMGGGTFTVSNVGMFGIKAFTPVINVPQAAILGVCAVRDEEKTVDGVKSLCRVMGLSLTFDHRAMDGAAPAMFVQYLCQLLENPLLLLA